MSENFSPDSNETNYEKIFVDNNIDDFKCMSV